MRERFEMLSQAAGDQREKLIRRKMALRILESWIGDLDGIVRTRRPREAFRHGDRGRRIVCSARGVRRILNMLQPSGVVRDAVKIDVYPPYRVVRVGDELSAREVLTGGAHASDDDAVVAEGVFLDIAVVGRINCAPEDDLVAAPHAAEVLPDQAAVMHLLANMRANWRAAKSRRAVGGRHARQLEIV